jgi:hypothetical protein
MLAIGMLAAAAGLVLGLRFSLITLLLLTLAIVITFATSVLGGSGSLAVGLQMLATLASVQISYLFGCLPAAHLPVRAEIGIGHSPMSQNQGSRVRRARCDAELAEGQNAPSINVRSAARWSVLRPRGRNDVIRAEVLCGQYPRAECKIRQPDV